MFSHYMGGLQSQFPLNLSNHPWFFPMPSGITLCTQQLQRLTPRSGSGHRAALKRTVEADLNALRATRWGGPDLEISKGMGFSWLNGCNADAYTYEKHGTWRRKHGHFIQGIFWRYEPVLDAVVRWRRGVKNKQLWFRKRTLSTELGLHSERLESMQISEYRLKKNTCFVRV